MPVRVIDASALAALVFNEPEQSEVAKQIQGTSLLAPTLIDYELASVCLKKLQRYARQRDALLAALALVKRMGIKQVRVDPTDMAIVADETDVTAYDAAYLWLSLAHRVPLITLDRKLGGVAARLTGGK
jgi:predicted nucleic acid-binding protein